MKSEREGKEVGKREASGRKEENKDSNEMKAVSEIRPTSLVRCDSNFEKLSTQSLILLLQPVDFKRKGIHVYHRLVFDVFSPISVAQSV